MKHEIIFLLAGVTAGLIGVAFGSFGSPEFAIVGLTWGVGPLFFVAVLAGIAITGMWNQLQIRFWRYLVGLIVITISYVMALTAFLGVFGFTPNWFGIRPSANMVDFHVDVWLGLFVAAAIGAIGVTLFTSILTGKWSSRLFMCLMLAGLITIIITYVINLPFHYYWSFLGVLLPVGSGLFCYLVGGQIQRGRELTERNSFIGSKESDH